VQAILSGTPKFWKRHAPELRERRRVGIGLRTSYDHGSLRIRDVGSLDLPRDLINIGDGLGEAPPGRGVKIETREDSQTGADLHTVTFDDWGARWTPVVLEFDAAITSGRGRGSCYLALPQLIGVDTPAVDDAAAAASGAPSVFDLKRRPRGAATFGRVIVRTGGRLLDGEARPTPDFVDGNPWVSELGDIGEEAAVWRCEAAAARDQWPQIGTPNRKSDELPLPTDATEKRRLRGLSSDRGAQQRYVPRRRAPNRGRHLLAPARSHREGRVRRGAGRSGRGAGVDILNCRKLRPEL